ncbi:MAG: SUMF1/EgtB/PvdO family nonheme iron enzyme [Planctomycetota bacterium]|jgi:formylglycine-generating enzyme required for sulfatase activity
MFEKRLSPSLVSVAALVLLASAAQAVSIDFVPVGNPGNPDWPDPPKSSRGGVDYKYFMGTYEVTAGQYTEFLNAVAADDTYGLYSGLMVGEYACGIQRSGAPGSYTYSVDPAGAQRPVTAVSFWDACRFVNWLHNGLQTGAQDSSTTEDGAYTLNGYI